jgi:hypothetical protein
VKLILESGRTVSDPSAEDIAQALPVEGFAILSESTDAMSYMQFAKGTRRHQLEYQQDSIHNHFEATDTDLTIERIIGVFQKYASGDQSWRDDVCWKPMKL